MNKSLKKSHKTYNAKAKTWPPNEPALHSGKSKDIIFDDNVVDVTPKGSTLKGSTAKTRKNC